jgi:hypothetical protein
MVPLPANLVISNVRGLPVPLYLAGARVEELYPISMLQVANGMNVTAVTHDDQVDFGFLVDRSLVRDPWIYADGVREALREIEVAVASRSKLRKPDAASALPDTPRQAGSEPDAARRDASSVNSSNAIQLDAEPLNLQLMMSELSHIHAPSRKKRARGVAGARNDATESTLSGDLSADLSGNPSAGSSSDPSAGPSAESMGAASQNETTSISASPRTADPARPASDSNGTPSSAPRVDVRAS